MENTIILALLCLSFKQENLKGTLLVEQVFRGVNCGIKDFSRVAYKTDYRLIPKHEEYKFIKAYEEFKPPNLKLFPPTIEMPPLFRVSIFVIDNIIILHVFKGNSLIYCLNFS